MKLGLILGATVALIACAPAKTPDDVRRDTARATITLIAEAVSAADEACAVAIGATRSEELGEKCRHAYDAARSALLVAQAGIDGFDAGKRGEVGCAVVRASGALAEIASALNTASVRPPPTLLDAITLVSRMGFGCPEKP